MFAQVAVPLRLPALTYKIPEGLTLMPGDPVLVKVRQKTLSGIVLETLTSLASEPKFEIRPLEGISEEFPKLQPEILQIIQWAADYYHCPVGEVLRGFLPPDPAPRKREHFSLTALGLAADVATLKGKAQRALVQRLKEQGGNGQIDSAERAPAKKLIELGWIEKKIVLDETMPTPTQPASSPFTLTDHQAKALEEIRQSQDDSAFRTFLIQGVTGSGKTEVYLRAATHALARGKSVLVVVPEIALTPQLLARFRQRLGENIAVLHSGISDGERSHQWHQLNRGAYRVCIGARSAAFAPMTNLGLIVVDEEHDSALKQEDHLRYHARDLAVMRGKISSATVLLGSATPSLESFHNALGGRFRHILLPDRASGRTMPEVTVVDRTKESAEGSLSPHLSRSMRETLSSGGQVMLLLNRRGFSSFLLCGSCGHVPECPNCSVSLTNYQSAKLLKCHYCGHSEKAPKACGKCAHDEIFPGTLGTESLEEEVKAAFPDNRVIRIDRESVERKGSLEAALAKIATGEAEIIIGTQIIAKGHDFPNIALVGVVNADSSFHLPDFRASEKSFQLFTQMAGRAGRGDRPGKVILQTYNPLHPSIIHSTRHDYRNFAEEEMRFRHAFQYPPYHRMARLLLSAPSPALAEASAEKVASLLMAGAEKLQIEIVGPAPAALAKVQNRYRWNLLLKAAKPGPLHTLLAHLRITAPEALDRKVMLQIDVDPVSLM
jgi:primosomal protein N' (replication factor Y) (superfamily II helicase)